MTLEEANKTIKDATIVGIITISITIILTLVYVKGVSISYITLWNAVDIPILIGLTYGIYRKSRVSALSMLIYFMAGKIMLWVDERVFIGLPLALVFAYFFWRGFQGTLAYHQYKAKILATN